MSVKLLGVCSKARDHKALICALYLEFTAQEVVPWP